tara:strand:- start:1115 stop:5230 length:4116 start_codon:yes stop_codon:yes gene_type:complete
MSDSNKKSKHSKISNGNKNKKHTNILKNNSNKIKKNLKNVNENIKHINKNSKIIKDNNTKIKSIKKNINNTDETNNEETNTNKSNTDNNITNDKIDDKEIWDIINSYFNQKNKKNLITHQYDSYEQFIDKYINDVLQQFNPIKIDHGYVPEVNKHKLTIEIEFLDYTLENPILTEPDGETICMTPAICRLRNLTYSGILNVNLRIKRIIRTENSFNKLPNLDNEDIKDVVMKKINFGKIPIMVQSKYCILRKNNSINQTQFDECKYDMGGYFIINGNEKAVVGQERIAENKSFVFRKQKQNKNNEFEVEIRSIPDDCFAVVMTNTIKYLDKTNILEIELSTFKQPINLFILLRYLGMTNDKKLMEIICLDINDTLISDKIIFLCKNTMLNYKNICKEEKIKTDEDIINYLIKLVKYKGINKEVKLSDDDKIEYLKISIQQTLLPHIKKSFFNKALYIGYMVRKLFKVKLGLLNYDDRDSYQNKRIETTGYLMASLFRQCLNRLVKDMTKSIIKELNHNKSNKEIFEIITSNNIYKIVKSTSIEGGLKYSLATGNWGIKTNGKGKIKVGAAQVLSRLSYLSYVSHLRRLTCPTDKKNKNSKIVGPRKQHASQFGYICPAETPEGAPVGLVKNMSLGSTITLQYNSLPVRNFVKENGLKEININNLSNLINKTFIFVNGDIIGYHNNPSELVQKFKMYRTLCKINPFCNINWDIYNNEIFIFTDAGRLTRPLLCVSYNDKTNENEINIKKSNLSKNFKWYSLLVPGFKNINFSIFNNYNNTDGNNYNNIDSNKCNNKDNNKGNNHNNNNDIGISNSSNLFELNINYNLQKLNVKDKRNQKKKIQDNFINQYENIIKQKPFIELIDSEEVNSIMICRNYKLINDYDRKYNIKFTHSEIHAGLMLGVLACVIPFSDHNQSPRNAYQSSMGKQAMSCYSTNYLKRLDTLAYVMNNLERAMVYSRFSDFVHYNDLPCGMNAMVAIACYSGYNQEDSIILNGNSINNGLFRATYYHVYKDEEKKIQSNGKEEKFSKPNPEYTKGIKPGNYDKLDERGFVKENEFVTSRDVIIGKKLPMKNQYKNGHQLYKDCSTSLRMNESGYIDKVFIDRNEEGFLNGKVRIRNERIPTIGDKFASRCGQKGTVGMILPKEQMPFTSSGMVPDIIMTPHAIPSRMTIGQLLECILGKVSTHLGGFNDCTPFNNITQEQISEILEENGFDYSGNEIMYSGITGKQMEVSIFYGPTFYQRLKHMVKDKMHSRNSGPVVQLTRQPAEGRSRDGGLRIGEMEKDCMNAHGTVSFLKERLLDVSDKFEVFACAHCGNYSVVNTHEDIQLYRCDNCENFNSFRKITIPYAVKLLSQELQGMGMNMRYLFDENI